MVDAAPAAGIIEGAPIDAALAAFAAATATEGIDEIPLAGWKGEGDVDADENEFEAGGNADAIVKETDGEV